ncbi:MAG: NUDIX hydrolase [Coriobacteriia bacterium]|nr:NUDIX hydrolase [Coriobacteriia bacterium]
MVAPTSDGPRVRVAAVILIGGKLLLVRQRKGGEPYYLLPGGGVNRGETLEQALRREVREETGLECSVGAPILINDTIAPTGGRHLVNITFHAEATGGALLEHPTDRTIEGIELVELSALEGLDLRPPIAQAVLAVIESGFHAPAHYLGSMWAEDR